MARVSHGASRSQVAFDATQRVAKSGLSLVATMTARLGLEAVVDTTVRLGRSRLAPGREVLEYLVMATSRSGASCGGSSSAMAAISTP